MWIYHHYLQQNEGRCNTHLGSIVAHQKGFVNLILFKKKNDPSLVYKGLKTTAGYFFLNKLIDITNAHDIKQLFHYKIVFMTQ